jgi:hypothetical protein
MTTTRPGAQLPAGAVVVGFEERYPDVSPHRLMLAERPVKMPLESPFGHVRSSIVDRSPCPGVVVPVDVREPA